MEQTPDEKRRRASAREEFMSNTRARLQLLEERHGVTHLLLAIGITCTTSAIVRLATKRRYGQFEATIGLFGLTIGMSDILEKRRLRKLELLLLEQDT
jgi:hypothetical protein